jgi:hypothetical protein
MGPGRLVALLHRHGERAGIGIHAREGSLEDVGGLPLNGPTLPDRGDERPRLAFVLGQLGARGFTAPYRPSGVFL